MDLLEVNAKIVRGVAENVAKHSPNAVIVVVSNPLDEMTALTQLASGFPKNRVFGQAGRARHRALHQQRGDHARRAGLLGADAHPRLAW